MLPVLQSRPFLLCAGPARAPSRCPPRQITIFPAFLTLDARREVRKRKGKNCGGCALPGPCIKDEYADDFMNGIQGWTIENEIKKVTDVTDV